MLYCPRCKTEYEGGSQRFCNNDGTRLLPVSGSGMQKGARKKGVFTSVLTRRTATGGEDESPAVAPRPVNRSPNLEPEFGPTEKSSVFKPVDLTPSERGAEGTERSPAKPAPAAPAEEPQKVRRPVEARKDSRPAEPAKKVTETRPTAGAGPRSPVQRPPSKPVGRPAVSRENPRVLLGQMVKGRYFITRKLDQDSAGITYLAKDKIRRERMVVLRVLIDQKAGEELRGRLLAEERTSLSHIEHPHIVRLIDSGQLPEGMPFVVTEYIEKETVRDHLKKAGPFDPARTAGIIRQASLGLTEAHHNGVLHRNLQPQHLIVTFSPSGEDVVKLGDLCVSDGRVTRDNFMYKAPEQLRGEPATILSDSYSLAVVAYQMLTNRLPFNPATGKEMLRSQHQGPAVRPSDLNPKINPLVDDILAKALSFEPNGRYPKARDFGEAFYNALTTSSPWTAREKAGPGPEEAVTVEEPEEYHEPVIEILEIEGVDPEPEDEVVSEEAPADREIPTPADREIPTLGDREIATPADPLWERRSPEPVREKSGLWILFSVLGLLVLFAGVFAIWQFFGPSGETPVETGSGESVTNGNRPVQGVDPLASDKVVPDESIESPPVPRDVETPEGFVYFENSKQALSPELARNFRGFSISYPENWKRKRFDRNRDKVDDKFLDIARETPTGLPIESLMISPYKSRGTFSADQKLFPELVERSNRDLSKSLSGNFEVVSEGETTIQNGRWKAYQVNFRTREKGRVNGREIELWGRRLWIPVQRPGVENGFIITMFATSLSENVKSADDVGKKGDLARILETFEPAQNY